MKKFSYLIAIALILGLVLTGCSLLSNISQVPTTGQSGVTYLTKGLPSGLVGWWRFNRDADDSSGNNNNGTVEGGAIYEPSPMGQALSFDGVDDYVNCGSGAILKPTQNITIEMWVKPSSTQNQYADILGGHQNNQGYVVQQNSTETNKYYFAYNNSGFSTGWQGMWIKTQLVPDVWQHFVVQKEGNIIRHFLDGIPTATGSVSGDIWYSPTEPFYIGIGWNLGSNRYFKGSIDDVRIWNFALSEGQLGKVYDWTGFFRPVENPGEFDDVVNVAKAGRAIPVKFSLGGDQGLGIFEVDYPKWVNIDCDSPDPNAIAIEETVTAGESSLNYDATADQYIYVWKTEKAWAGKCRQLVVKLIDGTYHRANFEFK
jgi:hypothetical protein